MTTRLVILSVLLAVLSACSRSRHRDSAPRVAAVPEQTGASGVAFTLDLASYVVDEEAVTFSVVSGGGTFTGSTYSHEFPTLGAYPVMFRATDTGGNGTTGSFTVRMTSATLMVIQHGGSLSLWETTSGHLSEATVAAGHTDTFKTALATGAVIYERTAGSQTDLYLFDLSTPKTVTLGDDASVPETYVGKTSTDKVVFTKGLAGAQDIYIHDPVASVNRVVSAVAGEDDGNVFINGSDIVFYQRQSSGQYDIYYYDPATDSSTVVSTAPTDEVIRAVLPDGGIVFSRIDTGGEQDLYYFRIAAGAPVLIGGDLESTIGAFAKAFAGRTSASRVVFTTDDNVSFDLYVWDPATSLTVEIAATAVDETFAAVSALDKVIYNVTTGPDNNDLYRFDPATGNTTAVVVTTNDQLFNATLSDGDVIFTDVTVTGRDCCRWDDAGVNATISLFVGNPDYVFQEVLSGDKVVVSNSAEGLILLTTGGGQVVTPDTSAAFGGETSAGDFVFSLTATAQTDLYLWVESSSSPVAISTASGNENFGLALPLPDGRVAYSRVATGATTSNVFVWERGVGTTQVTDSTVNDSAVAVFTATVQ